MLRKFGIFAAMAAFLVAVMAVPAFAQSGHFVGTPPCTANEDFTLTCTGKVAGLGGTTFQIDAASTATVETECTNKGGNVAPGQTKTATATASTGPQPTPTNGQYQFSI